MHSKPTKSQSSQFIYCFFNLKSITCKFVTLRTETLPCSPSRSAGYIRHTTRMHTSLSLFSYFTSNTNTEVVIANCIEISNCTELRSTNMHRLSSTSSPVEGKNNNHSSSPPVELQKHVKKLFILRYTSNL